MRDVDAHARPLVVDLRVGFLILRGVRHGDRRPVKQVDVPTLPQPPRVHGGLQGSPGLAGHIGEEGLGQALAGLAVGAGLCGARALSLCQAVGDQAGDGGTAGVVCTEDLSQEDPQGDQGGKAPTQPAGDALQRLRESLFGEDVRERQVPVLEELAPQKLLLVPEPLLVRMAHPWGLLAVDGVVGNPRLRNPG
jgi:hypothetical protein